MKRALHTLLSFVAVIAVMAMAAAPVSASAELRAQLQDELGAAALASVSEDCDAPAPEAPADDATVICGEGLMPAHVQLDPGLYAMTAEECDTLLDAIYRRAACDPLDADCGAVVPGTPPPPGPERLASPPVPTLDARPDAIAGASGAPLGATDDRVPTSLILEPPLRPPAHAA